MPPLPTAALHSLLLALGPLLQEPRPASGVPLGGLGAGKLEIFEDGSFGEATFHHNPKDPLDLAASFLAVRIESGGEVVVRALRVHPVLGFEPSAPSEFDGLFPRARFAFRALPLPVEVEAFSPLVPGDAEASAFPGAIFVVRAANPDSTGARVSVLCAFENLLGCGGPLDRRLRDRTGNFVDAIARGPYRGLRFVSDRTSGDARRNHLGEHALLVDPPADGAATFRAYDAVSTAGELRDDFAADGALDGSLAARGIEGRIHPGGALAVTFEVPPGGRRECAFAFSWNLPHCVGPDGRDRPPWYTRRFAAAGDAAAWALRSRADLLDRTRAWQDLLFESTLPGWLCRKLLADASVLFANSVWTADGGFATLESLGGMDGALGAMDRRLPSHAVLSAFFPELDRRELSRFAAAQRPDGAIPRHLGGVVRAVDASGARAEPEDASAFVLQVARTYRWTGDRDFLDAMAPHVRSALAWLGGLDADGDGLPEAASGIASPGRETAHASILYLAATRAGAGLARTLGEAPLERDLEARFEAARRAIVGGFWNGDYFREVFDPRTGSGSNSCALDQLAGEWFATLLGADPLLPAELVDRALDSVQRLNGRISPHLPPLLVEPDGRWASSPRARIGEAQAYLAALAITRGRVDEGLEVLEAVDRSVRIRQRDAWGSPDELDALTGEPAGGRGGMGRASSWFSLYALAGFSLDAVEGSLRLAPNFPRGSTRVVVPLFTPGFLAVVDAESPPGTAVREIRFEVRRRWSGAPLRLARVEAFPPPTVRPEEGRLSLSLDGIPVAATVKVAGAALVAELLDPIVFQEGHTLALRIGGPPGPIEVDARTGEALHGTGSVRVERVESEGGVLRIGLRNESGVEEAVRLRVRGWPAEEVAFGDRRLRREDLERGLLVRVPGRAVPDREADLALAAVRRLGGERPADGVSPSRRFEDLARRLEEGLRASEGAAAVEIALADPDSPLVEARPAGFDGNPREDDAAGARAREARAAVLEALREEVTLLREALRERQLSPEAPPLPERALDGIEIDANRIESLSPEVPAPFEITVRNRLGARTRGRVVLEPPAGFTLRGGESAEIDDLRPGEELRFRRGLLPPADWPSGRRRALRVRGRFDLGGVWFEKTARFHVGRAPLERWLVVGPFDDADHGGFDRTLAPEAGIDLGASYPGKGGTASWKGIRTQGGAVDLEQAFGRVDQALAYAVTWIRSPADRDVVLEVATQDGIKIWLDEALLLATHEHATLPRRFALPATLDAGWNRLLVKTEDASGEWSFVLEVTDPAGESYDDLEISDRPPGG